jgi:hypothetical protein
MQYVESTLPTGEKEKAKYFVELAGRTN